MSHIMVDLETLGDCAGCAIISLSAVEFSISGSLGDTFDRVISQKSNFAAGLTSSPDTLKWWDQQSPEARRVLAMSECAAAHDLRKTLIDFAEWISDHGGAMRTRVWGNGASFDNAILAAAYRKVRLPLPWQFYNDRCYRTHKATFRQIKAPPRVGIAHNSLDDAKSQALHEIEIMKFLAVLKNNDSAQIELSV